MTLEELHSDNNFLEDLRKGEYCLVLGAGFSNGLKNKTTPDSISSIKDIPYKEHKTIPLVSAYIKLTNKIFNDTTTKGEAAANLWENNKFYIEKGGKKNDLKSFYRDLFTLDKEWFRANKLKNFKNILLPDWYQVYTFNFDDVFETIVEQKGREPFYSLHFPEHSGIKRTNDKAIVHLHGFISETPPEKLTFSDRTYNYLRDSKRTLYDQFYTDVNSGKKLVIIGTQFDEKVIDDKFFSGLENKNITIFHFDLYNDNFKTKPGISGNPNYNFIKISDTHEVLDFFEKHRTHIENIRIEGADVINSDFIDKVKNEGTKEAFTTSDFYLAKQVDECQWYGVTQNWVVERGNYNFIKQETIASFADEKRNSKISVLAWGPGGSGKSTLLRKLAFDLSNEDFAVLWIKDKNIQIFYDQGLSQLRSEYNHKQFLVVIEDLYRVKQQDINLKEFFNNICSYSNIRLLVGDRKNGDSSYREHIFNPDKNIVELSVDDNKIMLDKLLGKIPDWKTAAEKLLKTDEDYKSTLYYILWSIGRTAQKEKEGNSVDIQQDLISHFRGLVQSDLKALSVNYPGVAKMLFYWASIYAKNKIYIAYDLFLKLAELFNAPSAPDSKMILASHANKSVLDIYTHKSTGFIKSAGELPLFAFNHDILAEDGLSKSKLDIWHPLDDSIKLTILPVVIQEGDGFSSSNYLLNCLITIPESVFSKSEKRKSIDKLLEKGVFRGYLSQVFRRDFYSSQEKFSIADKILSQESFWTLDKEIVTTALNISKDKDKANIILSQGNFWNLVKEIVSTALNISKDKGKADIILSKENFWKELPFEIVSTALNISKDKNKADIILSQENFWNLPYQIVTTALNISKDKVKADIILSKENFWSLDKEIVSTALNISKDKGKADIILSKENFWNELPFEIVSMALSISENENLKEQTGMILFESGQWKEKWNVTYHILYFYSSRKNIPKSVTQICETVISEYLDRLNVEKGKYYRYINLMKIPLHSVALWKRSSLENIKKWESLQRNIVTNTILAYRSYPSEIKSMCELILRIWYTELTIPIYQRGRKKNWPHFGDHIRLSLGHPHLKKLAKQTALKIKKNELDSPGVIPEHLLNVVTRILDENIFPVWNSENNDKQE